MKKELNSMKKYGLLALTLPFMAGCGAGAAGLGFLGSLFGSSGTLLASAGGTGAAAISGAASGLGGGAATIVNPEPATMLLMGSGMAAMACYKKFKQ